ncbi:hypothetical protein, partial [Acinetobacter bereziniae]|uniref:hypothetical protein n=1 Tax=Acinetobacter bereziniae TaxID=106648 RepID=UPI0021CD90D9
LEYGLGITAVSKVFYSVANFIYLAIHIIEIPKNTNGRFSVIHNGKAEPAQSHSNGKKIRWGYGVELNHATYEYLFGSGDVDRNKLQELRATSGDGGIVWNFDFDNLEFQENFDDGDERGMGEKILKEGSCENLGFKPTKTYTDLVGRVEFFTMNRTGFVGDFFI